MDGGQKEACGFCGRGVATKKGCVRSAARSQRCLRPAERVERRRWALAWRQEIGMSTAGGDSG